MSAFAERVLWTVSMADAGEEDRLLDHARKMGAGGVAIRTTSQRLQGCIGRFHQAGLKVYGWRWPAVVQGKSGHYAIDEAKAVAQVLIPAGLDGYIVDLESENDGAYNDWNRTDTPIALDDLATSFCEIIRAAAGDTFALGLTSGGNYPETLHHLPWKTFVAYSDALFPQLYWRARNSQNICKTVRDGTPKTAFDACLPSWRAIAAGKPILPMAGEISCIADFGELRTFSERTASEHLSGLHLYADDADVSDALCAAISALDHATAARAAGDEDRIANLVAIASDRARLLAAQHEAAQRLLAFDGEKYPSDGCAITLSVLLQVAGIAVPDVFRAIDLGKALEAQQWTRVAIGQQRAGDVGSTCGAVADHGKDHIYLVLQPLNADEMIIADNQEQTPHFRFASGKGGKTPTRYFLRAPI